MDKALVIGAAGGLGRTLMARLPDHYQTIPLTHADLDISRRNDVLARVREFRPEVIFNAAGVSDVDQCETDRWQAYLVNRDGAKHLAAAAAEVGALLVVPSSDLVFDGAKAAPYKEEDSPNPLSIFGDTKLGAELAAMSGAPRHLIVRTGWLFGPFCRSFLSEILDKRETDEVIFGFDDQRNQPTYAMDFVDAMIELAKLKQTGVWNIASLGEATYYQFGRAAYELLGLDPERIKAIRRGAGARSALRPRYSVLDCSKLMSHGIQMRPWIEALREYLHGIG